MSRALGRFLAMSLMMGAMSEINSTGITLRGGSGRRREINYVPLDERTEKFNKQVEFHNQEKAKQFKNWKLFQIQGVDILAYSEKNAFKIFNKLMKGNGLCVKN